MEKEHELVAHMRELVPSDLPDGTYVRFLRARKYNLENAVKMFSNYVEWRKTSNLELITLESVLPNVAKARAWVHFRDRQGRPCCVIQCCRHIAKENVVEEVVRMVIFYFQVAEQLLDAQEGKFTLLINFKDWTMANVDYPVMKELINILQNCYPERLGAAFVVFAPLLFRVVWPVVRPWLDQVTASKVHILGGRASATLLQHFDPQNLQQEFGGTSTFRYDSEHFAPDGVLGVVDPDRFLRPLSLRPGERMLFSRAELEAVLGHALPEFTGGVAVPGPSEGAAAAAAAAAAEALPSAADGDEFVDAVDDGDGDEFADAAEQ